MRGRRVVLAGVGAAVVVVLLWYVALWRPRQSSVSDAKARARAAEQNVGDLELRLRRLQDLKNGEASKQARLESLRVAVPDTPNLAQFILDANEAASKSGIDVLTITPSAPGGSGPAGSAAPSGPVAIRVSITASGGYFQAIDFLNQLADLPRIVVIDTLNVNAGNNASSLSLTLAARIFTTPAGAAALAPPSATASTTTTTVPAGAGAGAATTTSVP